MNESSTRCDLCGGRGWQIQSKNGADVAVRCACRGKKGPEALLRASRIPERYLHCSLDSFQIWGPPKTPSAGLEKARDRVREFIDSYPSVDKGILFTGRVGTGKTHLAVAALRELVLTKHACGLYVDFMDLIQQLQMSFDGDGASRHQILDPVLEAELLVLDELGSGKTGPWVNDMLYFVVNSRYLGQRLTLFTTNYSDKPAKGEESLADRISLRVRSRLYEMCETVGLYGEDYREHVLKKSTRVL